MPLPPPSRERSVSWSRGPAPTTNSSTWTRRKTTVTSATWRLSSPPAVRDQLRQQYGEDPLTFFLGKRIAVAGTAFRVKINLVVNHALTGLYYYQTHIHVVDAAQIRLLPGR